MKIWKILVQGIIIYLIRLAVLLPILVICFGLVCMLWIIYVPSRAIGLFRNGDMHRVFSLLSEAINEDEDDDSDDTDSY